MNNAIYEVNEVILRGYTILYPPYFIIIDFINFINLIAKCLGLKPLKIKQFYKNKVIKTTKNRKKTMVSKQDESFKVGDFVAVFYNDTSSTVAKLEGTLRKIDDNLVNITNLNGKYVIFREKIVRIQEGGMNFERSKY